jgi:hypothetical protein
MTGDEIGQHSADQGRGRGIPEPVRLNGAGARMVDAGAGRGRFAIISIGGIQTVHPTQIRLKGRMGFPQIVQQAGSTRPVGRIESRGELTSQLGHAVQMIVQPVPPIW